MLVFWDSVYNVGSTILAYLWWVCAVVILIAFAQYVRHLWRQAKSDKTQLLGGEKSEMATKSELESMKQEILKAIKETEETSGERNVDL